MLKCVIYGPSSNYNMADTQCNKANYCEICEKYFYVHLDEKIHKDNVKTLDFSEIDEMCKELSIQNFLSKYQSKANAIKI